MKKLKYFYYRYLYINPFYLWLKVGDRLKINGNSYTEMVCELRETKSILGEKINDTLSKLKRGRKENITNLNKRKDYGNI